MKDLVFHQVIKNVALELIPLLKFGHMHKCTCLTLLGFSYVMQQLFLICEIEQDFRKISSFLLLRVCICGYVEYVVLILLDVSRITSEIWTAGLLLTLLLRLVYVCNDFH